MKNRDLIIMALIILYILLSCVDVPAQELRTEVGISAHTRHVGQTLEFNDHQPMTLIAQSWQPEASRWSFGIVGADIKRDSYDRTAQYVGALVEWDAWGWKRVALGIGVTGGYLDKDIDYKGAIAVPYVWGRVYVLERLYVAVRGTYVPVLAEEADGILVVVPTIGMEW